MAELIIILDAREQVLHVVYGIYLYIMTSSDENISAYCPFVRGIHRSTVDSLAKGQNADLWCFLVVNLNKLLNKHSIYRLSETSWRSFEVAVNNSWQGYFSLLGEGIELWVMPDMSISTTTLFGMCYLDSYIFKKIQWRLAYQRQNNGQ